ncbi:hypothetical protein OCK02_14815 [Rhizobium sp. TRM96647]|uniref:hypothetical protein n=1 Tax=unclassified Rhizobium TaxID=2613769 RepID=UPI0021E8A11E|nr:MULTISPECIES: hypothetical protein [unclassified Rhizobium]MCV3737486.1 hypothetical protein [Rhizobium sp. TRM96647]MCV3756424.1 hypothetical protein [Rhizobium sp. TRM96650]
MSPELSVVILLGINLGLVWLLLAAPIGRRTLRLRRTYDADAMKIWSAVFPLGANADWHHAVISSTRIGDGRVRQAYGHVDRTGKPILRTLQLSDVTAQGQEPGQERLAYSARVVDDSALDPSFWRHYRERRSLSATASGSVLTIEQTDHYRGLAFLLFRYFSLRRETRALEQWLRKGVSVPNGLFERSPVQAGLAVLSTLLLWPFFGLHLYGLMLSVMLTVVIVLHELGHMAAYRACGHRHVRMIFIPFLGGVAIGGRPYNSLFEVAFCALMGAGLSAFLVPVLSALHVLLARDGAFHAEAGRIVLVFLAILGAFNLLNLLPMHRFDGGQVLRQVFSSRPALVAASFAVALLVLAIGWRVGLPPMALLAGLAVFTLLSMLGSRSAVKPRHSLVPMTNGERVLAGCGLYAAVGLHGSAIVYACNRLFG